MRLSGKNIQQISGIAGITVLSSNTDTIILLEDLHYSKEGACSSQESLEIDSAELLSLFDHHGVDFYVEYAFDPDFTGKQKFDASRDYISSFYHRYKNCFRKVLSKTPVSTALVPVCQHAKYHFIDVRFPYSGKNSDAFFNRSIMYFQELVNNFVLHGTLPSSLDDEDYREREVAKLQLVLDWLYGHPFIREMIQKDSRYLIAKQLKYSSDDRDIFTVYQNMMIDLHTRYVKDYIDNLEHLVTAIGLYIELVETILRKDESFLQKEAEEELLRIRKELVDIDASDPGSAFYLYNIYVFTFGSANLDTYTIARIQKNVSQYKSKVSVVYTGQKHCISIEHALQTYLGYTIIEKGVRMDTRCVDVSHLSFSYN